MDERGVRISFASYMLAVAGRGEMYYGPPATLGKLAAFMQGYILAIDQVGGQTLYHMRCDFCRFVSHKVGPLKLIHDWPEAIEKLASHNPDRLP
jgi:hypothetical protein